MPNTARVHDVLTRLEVALTQDWVRLDANPSDRDGVFIFNPSPTNSVVYRNLEAGGTAPTGAGTYAAGSGVIAPLGTRDLEVGQNVELYAYAVTGSFDLIVEETA